MNYLDLAFKGVMTLVGGLFLWQFLEFRGTVNRFLTNEWPHFVADFRILEEKVDNLAQKK